MTTTEAVLLLLPAGIVGIIGLIIWASDNDTKEQSKQRNEIHREPLYNSNIHWI